MGERAAFILPLEKTDSYEKYVLFLSSALLASLTFSCQSAPTLKEKLAGKLETIAQFYGPMHEQKGFNFGKDLRRKPYSLFRVKVNNATPIRLK